MTFRGIEQRRGWCVHAFTLTILVVAMMGLMMPGLRALGGPPRTSFKFYKPVALPHVVLPAGEYTFEVAGPAFHDKAVVRVMRRGGSRIIFTGLTTTALRVSGVASPQVVFLEDRNAEVPQIIEWYPTHNPEGYRFVYD